jgi:hypothetical protein
METIEPATLNDVPQLTELLNLLFTQEADFKPDREKQDRGLRPSSSRPRPGSFSPPVKAMKSSGWSVWEGRVWKRIMARTLPTGQPVR